LGPYVKDTSQQNSKLKHKVLVFDSGVGGLSVVAEIRKLLPNLSIDYLADDAFRPYGEKTVEAILERLPELISTLDIMLKPDAIVIACNTASTTALAAIRKKVSTPVIGVVPAIKPAAEMSLTKKIAVLGTPGTVRRQYVDDLIDSFAKNCSVKLRGTLKLVDYAERKLSGETIDTSLIAADIEPLFSKAQVTDIDTIVLACTHFPLLRQELEMMATAKNRIVLATTLAATNIPKDIGTAPLIMVMTLYGKGVRPAPNTHKAPLAFILSLNSVVYSALPSMSKRGRAIVSKNKSPIR